MKAKYIIHTVGPIYSGTAEDAAQLADCYRNSLDLAKEHDVHSIAFPAISTGVYGYPLEDATEIAVKTVATVAGSTCALRNAGDFLLLRCPDGAGISGKAVTGRGVRDGLFEKVMFYRGSGFAAGISVLRMLVSDCVCVPWTA